MKKKSFILILLIFTIFIVCIGGISAADNDSNSQLNVDNQTFTNQSSNFDVLSQSDNASSIKSDVHVTTDNGSEIQNALSNISNNNTVIYLDNQTFILNSTHDYGLCVYSDRNLTICGGYSIGDGKTSSLSGEKLVTNSSIQRPTLLINSNSIVTLININFIHHNETYGFGYALRSYGKLVLINCTFYNNTHSLLCEDDTVLINCTFVNSANEDDQEITNHGHLFEMQNCTLINTRCWLIGRPIINNSNFRNSSISLYSPFNFTLINSVFDDAPQSAIRVYNKHNSVGIIDNCTFSNSNSSSLGSAICYTQRVGNCIFNITNSKFNNNYASSGGAIYVSVTPYNNGTFYLENCSFNNNSALYGGACSFGTNVTLRNCSFNNNSALIGGSVYSVYYLNSTNCSYDDNSALYGGAIYGYNSNVLINGSSFKDNYALMAGGAVSSYKNQTVTGNSIIDNSMFVNNSADVCGGAVVIGNLTMSLSNSNFTSNDGQGYGNDVYSYGSNLTLNNNIISSVLNVVNDTLLVKSFNVSDDGFVVYLDNNTTGFCLEENFDFPGSYYNYSGFLGLYTVFNHTNIALNSLNYQKVGDYIKYIIVNYYGKVPDIVLNYAIWTFTDNNYTEPVTEDTINNIRYTNFFNKFHLRVVGISSNVLSSTLLGDTINLNYTQLTANVSKIVNDTLNAYNSGVRIPDHYVEVDENGTGTLYDFGSIFSNYFQNFITFKMSNYTVVNDLNITKITNTPIVYKGNDASFDIVVTNNGTMRLSNVTVTEDSFDDLVYKSSSNITGNWTYSFVDGKHTWTLVGYLDVNQTARFNVVFTTVNSTLGNKTNTVSVTTNENVTGNASNVTEVIENNTPETPENNTPNTPENNTPNKPTPVDKGTVENNNTLKADVKTTESTGYPFIALIIALIGIIGTGFRKK